MNQHFDGKYFKNIDPEAYRKKGLLEVLRWRLTSQFPKWPKWTDDREKSDLPSHVKDDEVFITFINHATFLIQLPGKTVLSDPVFSFSVGPKWAPKPKRVRPPGLALDELPQIDLVVISHNHFDHFDLYSLKEIKRRYNPDFIVPLGNRKLLNKVGIQKVKELDWWQEHDGVILTPAQHWSGRGFFNFFRSLWGGYLFKAKDLKVFFAGDTGYHSHFKEVKERYGAVDVALLPIGAYSPRWLMKDNHMDPEEAVLAHIDLGSKLSIGMHFGTFQVSEEGFYEPEQTLKKSLLLHGLEEDVFIAPRHGQTIHFSRQH